MNFNIALAAAIALSAVFPVAAQQSAESSARERRPEEIIVTARRREENLQTVPAAVSVISGDLLDSIVHGEHAAAQPARARALLQLRQPAEHRLHDPRPGLEHALHQRRERRHRTGRRLLRRSGLSRPSGDRVVRLHRHRARGSAARAAGHAVRQEHDRRRHSRHQPRAHVRARGERGGLLRRERFHRRRRARLRAAARRYGRGPPLGADHPARRLDPQRHERARN